LGFERGEKIDTYQSPETFIQIFSRPVLFGYSEIGSEYSEVGDTVVAGLPAKTFERHAYEFVDADDTGSRGKIGRFERIKKKVLTYHRYIVIPINGGFYRIEYAAEEGVFSSYLPIFEAVLASFKLSELAEVK
jgi:hypothetical protein